jgi:colicin import membrane protein
LARTLIIEEQLNKMKTAYINNINAQVYNLWNFRGAQKGWGCDVYVLQDVDGNVQAVDVQECNVDDSLPQAKAFRDSIERAVRKASPLPSAPDDAVFDRELNLRFRVY